MSTRRVLIIGGGQAGFSVAYALRKRGFEGDITIFDSEAPLPYQRPPLSKAYLLGKVSQEQLYFKPHAFYSEQRIFYQSEAHVEQIDKENRTISTNKGDFRYDELVIAAGSIPNRLPPSCGGDLHDLFEIKSIAGVDQLKIALDGPKKIMIAGGGYIGLETAAVFSKLGHSVTVVEAGDRILGRVASTQTSDYFRSLHQSHGVVIKEASHIKRFMEKGGRAVGAELVDGEKIEADIVIVGIGVKPNTALASSVGLEIENGVKTDAYGQTSRPSIWAAGDCASFPYKSTRCRLESVGHAIDHGQCVAANILGENTPYVAKPWFWSDQYDIKLQIVGLNHGFDDAVSRLDNGVLKSVWYYRGEQLLSVECMNDPRSYVLAKTALHADMNIPKSAAKDPEADLKSAIVDAST